MIYGVTLQGTREGLMRMETTIDFQGKRHIQVLHHRHVERNIVQDLDIRDWLWK